MKREGIELLFGMGATGVALVAADHTGSRRR